MKIAVIGKGNVGGTLGQAFAAAGHEVTHGSRSTPIPDALAGAETVVLALPGTAVAGFLEEYGPELDGKLVVDAVNRMGEDKLHSAADVAAKAPGARYARAFNSYGWENFADPTFDGQVGDLFYSSAEADKDAVEQLVDAVGLRPVYLGPDQYDALDGVLRLWFALAVGQGRGRHLAFRVL
ncbi:NADPH-dependent F420 reductase [Nonomuraea sediminis]|uniref:NADPH-dependent F420 reductase n=1 Tax=Nonomuraea sediminis TaxID=2835864 RepID=UPI001BDDB889|nr:hypothetical protein [Nonomuraea sediminis]